MRIPRDLAGRDLVKYLCRDWGYRQVYQQGSHIILVTETPTTQRLAIPDHKPLRIGTLNSILRAVAQHKGVSREKLVEAL